MKRRALLDEVDQHIHRARGYVASAHSARIWPFGKVLRRVYLSDAEEALAVARRLIGEVEGAIGRGCDG